MELVIHQEIQTVSGFGLGSKFGSESLCVAHRNVNFPLNSIG
jgi:hypothetical protein